LGSAGRSGALAGRPPIFSGSTSNVEEQPEITNASASANEAANGAGGLRRAFDIMGA
jgi:hypothetical protein